MFKRLRERIAEEATKFPVGQLANSSGKPNPEPESKPPETNSTEDLITLSDSSSVVVPHTSPQQFSIGEEEDGSLSEQSTPQKIQNTSSGDANAHHTPNSNILDLSFGQEYRPSKKSPYIPQSDIESEREDPPTLNLDGISKDQLMTAIQTLKARSYKYKNKYAEVVKNFKELREEKLKIENTLIENQDKGLRRIAELREQCLLEQKAKAHLEENLRLLLEEKDSRICVLETQINLLKEGGKSSSTKTLPEDCDSQLSDGGSIDTRSEDSTTSTNNDLSVLQEKVERLQHQISQDKKTISAQKEQISLLRKQNENISQELEDKVKKLNNVEGMQDQLKELEKQQEENVMSMAETKRNMHEELELKEKQLIKAEEESKQYQVLAEKEKEFVSELKKQYEEKVKQLQHQLEVTEKTLEDEKQSLLHELAQGKTAAINLVQQECFKKVAAVEETWMAKWEAHQLSCGKASEIEELRDSLRSSEQKLKMSEDQIEELDSLVSGLEKENASLKNSVEKLESEIAQSCAYCEKLKASYSDYDNLKEKEKLLKLQEDINRELNEKIMKSSSVENELKYISESLTCELNEKNNLILNLENEKSNLIEKIEAYTISQRELEITCDNLKNEIIFLKDDLKNQVSKIESVELEKKNKSKEIDLLREELKKNVINEKLASEKLGISLAEMREFEAENAELLSDNRLLNEEIQNIKCALSIREKELQSANESFSKAEEEICLLNETLNMKETMLKQAIISYNQVESLVTSLEKQQACIKSDFKNFQCICETAFKKCNFLSQRFDIISRNCDKLNASMSNKLKIIPENNQTTDIAVTNTIPENLSFTDKKCNTLNPLKQSSDFANNVNLCSGCEGNLKLPNMQNLHEVIFELNKENDSLKEELHICKTSAEMQDIEFAKSITILQQSLSDLQEERNNLSLVLQTIQNTQKDDANIIQDESKEIKDEKSDLHNWELRITELNSKVKSEIEALSLQTEVVNKELKCLRQQFSSSQDLYSEKLMQLNSKLLFRTETVIKLKEDLDSSIENANCLKELLEETRQELSEKNKLLNSLENSKRENENKFKCLKQDYCKKECELKEIHNSQLADLKQQTKSTIDKLNEELKKSNQHLKEKDEEFRLKLLNAERDYKLQISNLTHELENVLSCQVKVSKLSELCNSLEIKLFDSVSKLDAYSLKIFGFNSVINKVVSKFKEKDEKIHQQHNSLLCLQEEMQSYTELRKDFHNIQNELNHTSQLLGDANEQLNNAKEKLKSYDLENADLKTNLVKTTLEINKLSSKNVTDKNELQLLLDTVTQELEYLKTNQSKTLSDLNSRESELRELQEKYGLATNDIENLNKLLAEQKSNLELQSSATYELVNKFRNISYQIDNMAAEFNQHLENTNTLLEEKEIRIKKIDTKLSIISSEYESKFKEINNLKSKLSSCLKELEDCQIMLKEEKEKLKKSDHAILEWKSKYENSVKELDLLIVTSKDFHEKLDEKEVELCNAKFQLSFAEDEIKKLKLENEVIPSIQDTLHKNLEDLQNYQKHADDQDEKIKQLESEKHELELNCNQKDDILTTFKIEKQQLELMCNEQGEKIKKIESENHELELKYNENDSTLTTLENKEQEWEYICSKHVEKIEVLESEMHDLELKSEESIEKLKILGSEKDEFDLKYNKQVAKLKALQNEKCQLELKQNQQTEKLAAIESEKQAAELKHNEQTKKLNALEKEKHHLELKYKEQNKKLEVFENENQELKVKYDEQLVQLQTIENEKHESALKDEENIDKLLSEIKVRDSKINMMVSSEELNRLKETLQLETQKHDDIAKNLHFEMRTLLQSISEKDDIIKAKENEKGNLEARHEESLKCMKDKLQNAEKNYKTQVDEMKLKINQLEKENSILVSEKQNLLLIQNQFKELKSGEEKVQSELKSKQEELKDLREKLDTSNKEQFEKIHTFQESMKDKENMILKLKANIESISKEHKESVEELQKKIKRLEVEREQLMLQAQERVSATEAKCREDIKSLQEKCDKLLLENSEIEKLRNQLDESLLVAESNQASANQKISLLKDDLANAQKKLADSEKTKLLSESEFSNKLETLLQENKRLLHDSDHVERLKAEKEELNEKLKTVVQQVNKINVLQTERDVLKKENEELNKEINHLRTVQNDNSATKEKLKSLELAESAMKQKIEQLNSENEKLKSEILSIKNSFKGEKDILLLEKEKLSKRIEQLESCVSDPQNTSVQDYLETLKKEYEMAIKAKDDDMLSKLKQLVRDFSIQMDVKDKDSEQMMTELMEKNQYIEEKLQKEHAIQMQALREDLLEKECALEEMRDSYEEALQEKDAKITEQEHIIKSFSQKDHCGTESVVHGTAESSDWDDTWVVPDEVVENSSPNDNTKSCDEHVKQIESLQEELSKSNSEIKELKVLLRLSPPESIVNNNNRRDSLQSLPEPTEFEYLKNIIYEYMMGKEPVTLAKVIAAVLRFNDVQTQQVIRREEARHHPTR